MDLQVFLQNILNDLRIDLKDEFDQNFQRKAFFDQAWPKTKMYNSRGSLMMRSGNLRSSIQARIEGEKLVFSSSQPYASIHNEGGEITVTAKMKKYFWAKYLEAGKQGIEADQWKAMALKKLGSKIKIEQRRFIGDHPEVYNSVKRAVDANLDDLNQTILQNLKP